MLALSSLSTSARFVGVLYVGVLLFTGAIATVMNLVTGGSALSWLSFRAKSGAGGGRDLPDAPTIRELVGRIAGRDPVRDCRVGSGAAATCSGRRGGDVSGPMISAKSLSKWYGQVIGLNDVTVDVPTGVVGLLGPNGAGKSTFMKLVTGQLKPSKGSVEVFGRPIWGNTSAYGDIGYCPDQDAFYERMTGLEWVTALTRLTGLDDREAERTAAAALETVGLLDVGGKKIGGLQQGDASARSSSPRRSRTIPASYYSTSRWPGWIRSAEDGRSS